MNLLYGRSLRRQASGDRLSQVVARRRFLEAGWYEPLRDALRGSLHPGSALDMGCGEGYFTQILVQEGRPWIGAVDISVPAVSVAARRLKRVDFAVADAFALPVETSSVDFMMNIFGPVVPTEAERVLAPGALITAVGPGPRHLFEIRQLMEDAPRQHPLRGPKGFEERFDRTEVSRVTFTMLLLGDHFTDLVEMTPYARQFRQQGLALDVGTHTRVTADFLITRYRRK